MQFTPKNEDDFKRFELLPEGDYKFIVIESSERQSKSEKNFGRVFCNVKLAIQRKDGGEQWVFDSFADWFSEWKLKHFCEATGHAADYQRGAINIADNGAQGWSGKVRIIIGEDKRTGKPRNEVDDYIPREAIAAPVPVVKPTPSPAPVDVGDDVPF